MTITYLNIIGKAFDCIHNILHIYMVNKFMINHCHYNHASYCGKAVEWNPECLICYGKASTKQI